MPLPRLSPSPRLDAALKREHAKALVLGAPAEQSANELGAPLERLDGGSLGLQQGERELLQATELRVARAALDSRDGRAAWLAGVVTGELKMDGAFGTRREFPPQARLQAMRLLGLMHGDYVQRHEITVTEETVVVFHVPDNGRLPAEAEIVESPE